MQELIQKLQEDHGLTAEQSHGILSTITNFIKEKVPMAAGMIDNFFPQGGNPGTTPDANSNNGDMMSSLEDLAKSKLGSMFGNK